MNIGLFNERIILSSPVSSSVDIYGQVIPTYATSSVWAAVAKQNGSEANNNGVQYTSARYVFTIRNNISGSLDERTNVVFGGKTYNVVFVEEAAYTNKRFLKLTGERQPA
jgi:SPP1 family predicted phage head-tail adaptor